MGHIRESWGFSWVLRDVGGNSPHATSEAKAARLTGKGIRVKLSPGPLPRCAGLLSGRDGASSQGWNSGPEFHSVLCACAFWGLWLLCHISPHPLLLPITWPLLVSSTHRKTYSVGSPSAFPCRSPAHLPGDPASRSHSASHVFLSVFLIPLE